ncbi:MAG: hypothetical protein WCP28_02260 [Actinomycetes bacterium]
MLPWIEADRLAQEHGDSYYLLDEARLIANADEFCREFRARYSATDVAYPYKTNHLPDICRTFAGLGLFAEVASDMDWWLARRIGVDGRRILSNGPHRSRAALAQVMAAGGTVILDSLRDLTIVEDIARTAGDVEFGVGLRLGFRLGSRVHLRFGFELGSVEYDQVVSRIRAARGLRLAGLHCHFPECAVGSFAERARTLVTVADDLFDGVPDFLDVGGSFYGGVPAQFPGGGPAPSVAEYADAVCSELVSAYGKDASGPRLVIEPGTALVASALSLITRIVSIKSAGDRRFANVAGSILDTSPNTRRVDFPVTPVRGSQGLDGPFDIGGSTLIADEYLALDLPGPLAEGDFLEFGNVGAYSVSMVPPFVRPDIAVLKRSGTDRPWVMVRRAATPQDVFAAML